MGYAKSESGSSRGKGPSKTSMSGGKSSGNLGKSTSGKRGGNPQSDFLRGKTTNPGPGGTQRP